MRPFWKAVGVLLQTIYKLFLNVTIFKWQKTTIKKRIYRIVSLQKTSMLKLQITAKLNIRSVYTSRQRINIDTIGPSPRNEDMNKCIIVPTDCFSGYILLYPTEDGTINSAAYALLQNIGLVGST